jgi:hypothetical protein
MPALLWLISAAVHLHSSRAVADAFQIGASSLSVNYDNQRGWGLQAAATPSTISSSRVIRSEDDDFEFDEGAGGVRLAEESVLALKGTVRHKPGQAEPQLSELRRYTQLTEVDPALLTQSSSSFRILGTGIGTELYADPGETAVASVTVAPADAVRDCLMGVASALEWDRVCLNFAGGADAQVLEVLAAVREMVLDLDVKTKCQITYHSISHDSFPIGKSFLTVVGLEAASSSTTEEGQATSHGSDGDRDSVKDALVQGEVYFCNGKYWTVTEENRNMDLA